MIYKMPEKDFLKAFLYNLSTHTVSQTPALTATIRPPDGMPGGFSSVSANGAQNGIVWTSLPTGDSTIQSVPGRLVAFDAQSLQVLWEDEDPVAFSKFTPPTVADGKVYRATFANVLVVYGLLSTTGDPPVCHTIDQTYQKYGGASGILGVPVGNEIDLPGNPPGAYRQYHGHIYGGTVSAQSTTIGAFGERGDSDMPSHETRSDIDASIYWSPVTCSHVVLGQILALWTSLGAEAGQLGYPISDEIDTPDERGRRSRFQHGEIWWYPDRGAFVKPAAPH
jgi:hypothetical protein